MCDVVGFVIVVVLLCVSVCIFVGCWFFGVLFMLVCLCVVWGLLRDAVWFVFCVSLCVIASVIMCLCVVCGLLCDVV